ncbi:cytochrome P450 4C1-like [Anthonomus grandis grandis]|uniref:cytochrome P450 4C1-like n=1 Tax=Anthonomus grandis grandis TaxID=2921223 RepID=UPI002165F3F1|nr:cytochrome P450 4C1-like [Anthonomus grandis grandis]
MVLDLRILLRQRKSSVITEFLLIFLICTMLTWFLQLLWRKRKLYQASLNLPGPFALPIIGSAFYFIGKPYNIFGQIMHMFNNYPGIFRVWFGPRMFYAVSDPKYLEIILTSPQALAKENLYRMAQPVTGHGLFSTLSVAHWKKHRKIINPTFNQQILDRFMVVFVEQSEILIEVLKKYAGKEEHDILKLMTRCTLDIISETAMGVQIKAQSTDTSFPKWVDRLMEIVMIRIFNIYYHSDFIFANSRLGKEFYDITNKVRTFTKNVVLEKKKIRYNEKFENNEVSSDAEGTMLKRTAFLDLLIDINYEAKNFQFTDEELMDETITFMIAGSDTTASTNCFVLTMLGLHQDIQENVLREILEVVGEEGSVQLSHLPNLKYLERVIKETLRLFPNGPFLVRTAQEDIDLGDCTIQKGCSIVLGVLRSHRNEKYWPDSLKFDPDRFLPEKAAKILPGCFIPFSYGPRNCIGMKYAMMAMKTLLATVIRRYKLFTSYKSVKDIELKSNMVLRPKDGYKLTFELR